MHVGIGDKGYIHALEGVLLDIGIFLTERVRSSVYRSVVVYVDMNTYVPRAGRERGRMCMEEGHRFTLVIRFWPDMIAMVMCMYELQSRITRERYYVELRGI